MSRWSQNGHRRGGAEAIDDAVVEEILAGRYQGDAPDLVAVSQFVERMRAFADQPAPPPSTALARVLGDSAPVTDGDRPTTGREWLRDLRVRPFVPVDGAPGATGARSGWRTVPRPAVVAAAVSVLLIAAVVAAGSARLLPGPTQDVVANIVRTVTPFGFPEQREAEPALPKAPGASTAAPPDDPDTRARADSSPSGAGQPGTNGTPPVGPNGADGRPQPNAVDDAPRPAAPPAPRAAPTVPGPTGGPSQETATDPAPPPPPKPPDFKADLSGATGTSAAGDPDGRGTAFVDARPGRDELCLTLAVSGTAPLTSAHLHAGDVGVSGPVVAAFGESAAGPSGQCVAVSRHVIREIRKDPGKYYVDVHTAEFPDEALRGQLTP